MFFTEIISLDSNIGDLDSLNYEIKLIQICSICENTLKRLIFKNGNILKIYYSYKHKNYLKTNFYLKDEDTGISKKDPFHIQLKLCKKCNELMKFSIKKCMVLYKLEFTNSKEIINPYDKLVYYVLENEFENISNFLGECFGSDFTYIKEHFID